MPAPISVIIPTLNAQAALEKSLPDLFLGVEAGIIRELIISDGGSVDETKKIADEIGAKWLDGRASRGGQINRGIAAAQGEWCLILHADTVLGQGWCDAVFAFLHRSEKVGYFDLGFDAKGFGAWWVARWANFRSRQFNLPYGDQGVLIKTSVLNEIGYPDQPLMEDVEFAKRAAPELIPIGYKIQSSFVKYQRSGWLKRGAKNLTLLFRYKMGVSPEKLASDYNRSNG